MEGNINVERIGVNEVRCLASSVPSSNPNEEPTVLLPLFPLHLHGATHSPLSAHPTLRASRFKILPIAHKTGLILQLGLHQSGLQLDPAFLEIIEKFLIIRSSA